MELITFKALDLLLCRLRYVYLHYLLNYTTGLVRKAVKEALVHYYSHCNLETNQKVQTETGSKIFIHVPYFPRHLHIIMLIYTHGHIILNVTNLNR